MFIDVENAGWDLNALSIELTELIALEPDFEVEVTGFEMAEIDIFIGPPSVHEEDAGDVGNPYRQGPVSS